MIPKTPISIIIIIIIVIIIIIIINIIILLNLIHQTKNKNVSEKHDWKIS